MSAVRCLVRRAQEGQDADYCTFSSRCSKDDGVVVDGDWVTFYKKPHADECDPVPGSPLSAWRRSTSVSA